MSVDPLCLSLEKFFKEIVPGTSVEISGTASTLLVAPGADHWPSVTASPHLIVVESQKKAEKLVQEISFFNPDCHPLVLPAFDVSPFSALYPRNTVSSQRIRWLFQAIQSPPVTFVASIEALLQKTLPREVLESYQMTWSAGDGLADFHASLSNLGYTSAPLVEDVGQYSQRGSILDVFSPAFHLPIRIELYGDSIETMRSFDPQTQRSIESLQSIAILPFHETLYIDDDRTAMVLAYAKDCQNRQVSSEDWKAIQHAFIHGQNFPEMGFLLPFFYDHTDQPISFFKTPPTLWFIDRPAIINEAERLLADFSQEKEKSPKNPVSPDLRTLYCDFDDLAFSPKSTKITLTNLSYQETEIETHSKIRYPTQSLEEFRKLNSEDPPLSASGLQKLRSWKKEDFAIFIGCSTKSQSQRLRVVLENQRFSVEPVADQTANWQQWIHHQQLDQSLIHLIPRPLSESISFSMDHLIFLRSEDFFGRDRSVSIARKEETKNESIKSISFSELNVGDFIVHINHGVGIYEGLKVIDIGGIPSEFIQLSYKDGDKLYLPIYRIAQLQRYSGPSNLQLLDKLGGHRWEKTKIKVRAHLHDMAAELLKLYALRSQHDRRPFLLNANDFMNFEGEFPYEETEDQLQAVSDILADLTIKRQPMDRLICGDVGFGKTEVAMRAAFIAFQAGVQVAILAPTTVLTFQHLRTLTQRFKGWPVRIAALNRFVAPSEIKQTLNKIQTGELDIVIGTHRLLSNDICFRNLGLLVIDEEQKFGVKHKEKIRKLRLGVDTLALSATPIPRTLNLSLVGLRDLSLINTAPLDRLPTRTFVCRFDEETIRKAILAEVKRGGQVFFIHNRIHSIDLVASKIRELVPDLRIKIGHGQMSEDALEETMIAFFNHQVDVLVCTTIIESGMDVPLANTMFINDAHTFGLSQLYQLRGRVGRSKQRAYCYLIVPNQKSLDVQAQERLKVIQENTALGSGIRIAHYDLELRGAGDILGEDQSGHIQAVGYDLYLELLENELHLLKGESTVEHEFDPDINIRIPALIPDAYIPDIRLRLTFYKLMSNLKTPEEMEQLESDLRDQYGAPPEPVLNLMGLMLIRYYCKLLKIRDLSSGPKSISLVTTDKTPLPPEKIIKLCSQTNKKYLLTPDGRLNIRMNSISWPAIYDELKYLDSLRP